jgi:hypothetical protein
MGEAATAAVIAAGPSHVATAAVTTTSAVAATTPVAAAVSIDNDRDKCDEADGDEPHDGVARFAKMIQICGE